MHSLPDMNELMKIAASPAGQKLLELLQSSSKSDLNKIVQDASAGNYSAAKAGLSKILAEKDAKQLLMELERHHE